RRPPNTLPLVGNGLLFLQARHKLFSWFVKCEHQFGFETFQISVPSLPPGVVINDPKNLEYVFKNEGIFEKGDFVKSRSWDLFGNGIVNADGELWKVQRKAGLNFLSNANLKVLTEVALPLYLMQSIRHLRSTGGDSVTDLQAVFHELTTQLMGRMAYDVEMHHDDPFTAAFDYASGITGERFQNPLWQITEIFTGGKFHKSIAMVKAFGSQLVSKAAATRQRKESPNANRIELRSVEAFEGISGSLINSLLDSIGDHNMVADAALNYLTAGRDTTAQGLTWTFYLLMRHPKIIGNICNEVNGVINNIKSNISISQKSLFDIDMAIFTPVSLPYTLAAFYEALRFYPPVPFEIKQCMRSTTLPDGTFLPRDSILLWCPWAMNRSRLIWGDDAEQFKPERWLENGSLVSKSAFEFPVFNGGSRMCLGKKMAEVVAVQVVATMLLFFEFEAVDDTERLSQNSLTLPMEGGLPCFIRPREHAQ
ncbi:cytochrome P450, partial [Tricladium varicosporioides]